MSVLPKLKHFGQYKGFLLCHLFNSFLYPQILFLSVNIFKLSLSIYPARNTRLLDQKINKQSILVPVLQAPFSHWVTNDIPSRAPQEMHPQNYESWSLCRMTYTSVHPPLKRCRETFVLEYKFLSGERRGKSNFIHWKLSKGLQLEFRLFISLEVSFNRVAIQLSFIL